MLTLIFIIFVIAYFGHRRRNPRNEYEANKDYRWTVFAWVFIVLVLFHGC